MPLSNPGVRPHRDVGRGHRVVLFLLRECRLWVASIERFVEVCACACSTDESSVVSRFCHSNAAILAVPKLMYFDRFELETSFWSILDTAHSHEWLLEQMLWHKPWRGFVLAT